MTKSTDSNNAFADIMAAAEIMKKYGVQSPPRTITLRKRRHWLDPRRLLDWWYYRKLSREIEKAVDLHSLLKTTCYDINKKEPHE